MRAIPRLRSSGLWGRLAGCLRGGVTVGAAALFAVGSIAAFLGAVGTDDDLAECIRNHTKEDVRPASGGERIITMGVDQGKWSYVEICEWFFDRYSQDLNVAATAKVLWEGKYHLNTSW